MGIEIAATSAGTTLSLSVEDDGPGIAPADRAQIFDPFTRLDAARARDHGGVGLGLYLCRQIARAYGLNAGRIALTTEVDDMQLDLDRAVSCGLLINELITNAIKHAFPPEGGGGIHVRLQRQPGHVCLLTVRDNGAGMANANAAGGAMDGSLGLQLIQDLTDQLGGSKRVENDGGTLVAIAFPLDLPVDAPHEDAP